jgi:hypothetical protein
MTDILCQNCGAPAQPGVITCGFCNRPVSAEAAQNAVPCHQCKTLNVAGTQQCTHCKAWLVVQCVFCAQLTAYTATACGACGEAFAGAPERKAARDQQLSHQKMMETVGTVAPFAVGALGALAGAVIGARYGSDSSGSQNVYGGSGQGSSSDGFLSNVVHRTEYEAHQAHQNYQQQYQPQGSSFEEDLRSEVRGRSHQQSTYESDESSSQTRGRGGDTEDSSNTRGGRGDTEASDDSGSVRGGGASAERDDSSDDSSTETSDDDDSSGR